MTNTLTKVVGPTVVHKLRYAKHKIQGMSIEDIAKEEKVSEHTIRDSIFKVESYRAICNFNEVEAVESEILLSTKDLRKLALESALRAVRTIRNEKGKLICQEPDHDTRMRAIEASVRSLEALARRYSTTKIQQNTQLNLGVGVSVAGKRVSFETLLQKVRESQKDSEEEIMALPAVQAEQEEESPEEVSPNWDPVGDSSAERDQ